MAQDIRSQSIEKIMNAGGTRPDVTGITGYTASRPLAKKNAKKNKFIHNLTYSHAHDLDAELDSSDDGLTKAGGGGGPADKQDMLDQIMHIDSVSERRRKR